MKIERKNFFCSTAYRTSSISKSSSFDYLLLLQTIVNGLDELYCEIILAMRFESTKKTFKFQVTSFNYVSTEIKYQQDAWHSLESPSLAENSFHILIERHY